MARMMQSGQAAMKGIGNADGREKPKKITSPVVDLSVYNDPDAWDWAITRAYVKITKPFNELAYGKYGVYFDFFIIAVIVMAGAQVGIQTYPYYECAAPQAQGSDYWDQMEGETVGQNDKDYREFCKEFGDPWLGGDGYIDVAIFWIFVAEVLIKILANGAAPWMYWVGPERGWNNFDFFIVLMSIDEFTALFLGSGGGGNIMILRLFRLARLMKLVGKIKKLQSIVMGMIAGIQAAGYIFLLLFLVFYIFAIAGMMAFRNNDPFHFRTIPVSLLSLFRACTLEDWTDIMYISMYGCDKYPSGIYYVKDKYITKDGTEPEYNLDDHPYFDTWSDIPGYFKCNNGTAQPAIAGLYWILFTFISSFVMLSLFVGAITIAMSEQMDAQDEPDPEEEKKVLEQAMSSKAADVATAMSRVWNKYAEQTGENRLPAPKEEMKYSCGSWSRFAALNGALADATWFQTSVTLTIIAAGVTVGIDVENKTEPQVDSDRFLNVFLWYADVVINWIFTVEVLVKLVAEDWHPWRYFYDNWNKFDFVIVACSWLPLLLALLGGSGGGGLGALKLLRLLRLFRIMRVIKFLPELKVIIEALMVGMESIGFIALIMFVVFYLFAVAGMILFASNDPFHFGRLHRALLTLFRVSTFEDWTDVMYINVYGCSRWGYNDDDTVPLSRACRKDEFHEGKPNWLFALYFIAFIIFGSLVLLTLFVGVVTTSMEEAQSSWKNVDNGEKKTATFFTAIEVEANMMDDLNEAFMLVNNDGDGEVSEDEMKACMQAIKALPGDNFTELKAVDFEKVVPPDVPKSGNPFVFMIWVMTLTAKAAKSKRKFNFHLLEELEEKKAEEEEVERRKSVDAANARRKTRKPTSAGTTSSLENTI